MGRVASFYVCVSTASLITISCTVNDIKLNTSHSVLDTLDCYIFIAVQSQATVFTCSTHAHLSEKNVCTTEEQRQQLAIDTSRNVNGAKNLRFVYSTCHLVSMCSTVQ